MVRAREYDEDDVLAKAMHAFRRRGFAGLSIRDLEEATGLSGGSIYNSYGDKAGLFQAAFAHYLDAVLRRRIATHAPEAAGLQGLRSLFLSLLREPDGGHCGCLITNAAIEFGAGSDDLSRGAIQRGFEILRETLADRLCLIMADETVAQVTAVKLVALYQGVLVLHRAGYDRRSLKRAIDLEFKNLEGKL